MQKDKKIAILGGGNIGLSIAKGFIKAKIFKAENIIVTRIPSQPLDDILALDMNATHNNEEALSDADFVVFAVQPRQVNNLLKNIKSALNPDKHLIISVVSAMSVEDIEKIIGEGFRIVRIMPNTAIAICESMTCIAAKDITSDYILEIKEIFDKVGSSLIIEEKLMASATVLASCGTAFFLRFIRAASQGGIQVGFHAEEAQLIASQVAKGAAALLLVNGLHPEQEIDKVTTPMGLTIKGLNEMEHNGLSSSIIKGIVHSFNEMDKIK